MLLGVLFILAVLWERCGLAGCPDVDLLRGYLPEEASRVVDRDGEEIAKLFMTRRVYVPLDSVPRHVQDAFVAMEDRRFWKHEGVDWARVLAAAGRNLMAGEIEEGSSTITMQLARNVFPERLPARERTFARKLREMRVAQEIERRYSKREILELYLNQIYFGEGAWGVEAAAREYFGKGAHQLTLAEAATLAALPRAPSRLNPRADAEAALEGRRLVLDRMVKQGLITAAERDEAAGAKLRLRRREARLDEQAPYFVEAVRTRLEEELGDAIYTQGYTIQTTLDLDVQRAAEHELSRQLVAIESGRFGAFPHATYAGGAGGAAHAADGTRYLQGVVVLMEANTGDVLVLVGGRDFEDSEYNRALYARRQPGSAFKPIVYAAALEAGIPPTHRLLDRPLRMVVDRGDVWEPENYDGQYAGVVSMREALRHSKNVATVRLANEVGLGPVLQLARRLGLGELPANPSVVLGTAEVTPMQLTEAFSVFATLGNRTTPRLVTRVLDREGRTVWSESVHSEPVLDPAVAFVTNTLLRDVVDRGTGTGVRAAGFSGPAAGKTGTTQDAADVWFVGATPEYVATIWIGFDQRRRILRGATGGEIAAPVWGRLLRAVGAGQADWGVPAGVEARTVSAMGGAVGPGCPAVGVPSYTEFFVAGTAPQAGQCGPDQYLAYADSFGAYADSLMQEYERLHGRDEGWWRRLRERMFGRDSLGTPYPAQPAPAEITTPEALAPAAPPGAPEPLGRPVPETASPPAPGTQGRSLPPAARPGESGGTGPKPTRRMPRRPSGAAPVPLGTPVPGLMPPVSKPLPDTGSSR